MTQVFRTTKLSKKKRNYGGAFYVNDFRASKSIEIVGVAFYGPFDRKQCHFDVWVEIFESRFGVSFPRMLYKEKFYHFEVKEELFWVYFKQPVLIKANKWHTIEFELKGPDTLTAESSLREVDAKVDDKNVIQFEFFMGSMQMPALEFQEIVDKGERIKPKFLHGIRTWASDIIKGFTGVY